MQGLKLCSLVLMWLLLAGSSMAIVMNEGAGLATPPDRLVASGHVGTVAGGGLTVVYLGDGWVLTASHVGAQDVEVAGRVYQKAPDSLVRIHNDDRTEADLIAYRILGNPDLPDLPALEISATTPATGVFAILAGAGHEERNETRGLASAFRRTWRRLTDTGPSWGTNTIAGTSERVVVGDRVTDSIVTEFSLTEDLFATPYEAQAVTGDSGGALFVADGDAYVLAGVLFAASEGDPDRHEPSRTFAVNLARYREQIIAAVEAESAAPNSEPASEAARGPESIARNRIVASIAAAVALGIGLAVLRGRVRRRCE